MHMRICFFGDSFVNGTGDPECLGWAGRICAAARRCGRDLTYCNLGIRRDTAEDIAHRWQDEASARLPADADGRIVFSFGVNDCIIEDGRPRAAPGATLAHAEAMVTDASRRRPTLFIGPPPIADDETNRRIAALSTGLETLSRGLAVPYLDLLSPLRTAEVWRREVAAGDGAHPGPRAMLSWPISSAAGDPGKAGWSRRANGRGFHRPARYGDRTAPRRCECGAGRRSPRDRQGCARRARRDDSRGRKGAGGRPPH